MEMNVKNKIYVIYFIFVSFFNFFFFFLFCVCLQVKMLDITFALLRTTAYPIALDHFQRTFDAFRRNITVWTRHFASNSLIFFFYTKPGKNQTQNNAFNS